MNHAFFFEPFHHEIQHAARHFASTEIPHLVSLYPQENPLSIECVRAMGKAGLLRHTIPSAFSGQLPDLDSRSLCLVREALAYESGLVDTAFAIQGLGSYPILLAGTAEQKEQFLPGVADGSLIPAFAVTEPSAGSDVASLETSAVHEGSHYRLNGVKRFISNAGIADYYIVFARTSAEKGRGISAFIVDAHFPGLTIQPFDLIAPHPIGELHFNNCLVPDGRRLGEEGSGFKLAMATLDRFRPTVGAAALGLAQRALNEALTYTSSRVQFGVPLADHQLVKAMLADMATELEAARLLVFQAAWLKDGGQARVARESAMAKLFATEAAQRIIDHAVQLHGGNGVVVGSVVERLYREVRALRIYEGTSEVQRLVIAGDLLKAARHSPPRPA